MGMGILHQPNLGYIMVLGDKKGTGVLHERGASSEGAMGVCSALVE